MMKYSGQTNLNVLALDGQTTTVGAETIKILMVDSIGDILMATGTTVPTNATTGYAKSAIFLDTDVGSGTGSMYLNKGTNTSCIFSLVQQA